MYVSKLNLLFSAQKSSSVHISLGMCPEGLSNLGHLGLASKKV